MSRPAVSIIGVSHSFREGLKHHRVLDGIELEIEAGESIALLGRSGSGKSTLLNLIAGIDRPDEGRVLIEGETVTALKEPQLTLFRRRRIGFVYQFFNLIPTLNARENIELPLELMGLPRSERTARTSQALTNVDLPHRARAFPDQLSGGEQQRVAIARALIHRPTLVLADEPTGNLDQHAGEQVLQLMQALVREERSSLLLVTHSLAVASRADRVLTLEAGRLSRLDAGLAW